MRELLFVGGLILILLVLVDAFQSVVLPRRVSNRFRLAAAINRVVWAVLSFPARRMPSTRERENYLSIFGPLSLILLLVFWSAGLILGFAILIWASNSPLDVPEKTITFWTDIFVSGSFFFSGLGSITPLTSIGRAIMVAEGGMGFAFLALVIGYLPAVYQSFAQREAHISRLDARAGSPPTAFELLRRCAGDDHCKEAWNFMENMEDWSADLLETHLSYPVLGFYRSQHENQSWLAALAAILDTAALVSIGIDGAPKERGRLTFAMARHAIVDLAQVYRTPPKSSIKDRLTQKEFERIQVELKGVGIYFQEEKSAYHHLYELRLLYEPYLLALSDYLLIPIPTWFIDGKSPDNWESTAWGGTGGVRL